MTFPILASLLVRLVVLLPFQLLRLSLATPSRWTPLALSVFLRSEERFSRNAETDLVCRLLLEKKKQRGRVTPELLHESAQPRQACYAFAPRREPVAVRVARLC